MRSPITTGIIHCASGTMFMIAAYLGDNAMFAICGAIFLLLGLTYIAKGKGR
ncbi:MAG: hypothetical protein IKU80_04690 [Firmicutes bacterium]|nr:hypothetical protein [Bacillota bacterium]